jgi:hypothetical protein
MEKEQTIQQINEMLAETKAYRKADQANEKPIKKTCWQSSRPKWTKIKKEWKPK